VENVAMGEDEALADVTKELKGTKQAISIHAYQVALPAEYQDGAFATAKVEIKIDRLKVYEDDIPWPTPRGELGLALAMQTLAEAPRKQFTRYQPLLAEFVRLCDGYEPVTIFWTEPE
jgi:hypothetical protein